MKTEESVYWICSAEYNLQRYSDILAPAWAVFYIRNIQNGLIYPKWIYILMWYTSFYHCHRSLFIIQTVISKILFKVHQVTIPEASIDLRAHRHWTGKGRN